MGGAPGAEGAVARLAEGVVEHGDARPVVEGVAEFVLDGEAADHPCTLAGGDLDRPLPGATPGAPPRGHSAAETERAVVPTAEEIEGLGEQGAGHVDAHPGDGEEDGEVVGTFLGGRSSGRSSVA